MANGTLSFSLPEEQVEFAMACKAGDLHCVLVNFSDVLRSHIRHGSNPSWDSPTVEEIYRLLEDMRLDYCLHFD